MLNLLLFSCIYKRISVTLHRLKHNTTHCILRYHSVAHVHAYDIYGGAHSLASGVITLA